MAEFTEPVTVESPITLIGTATWPFTDDNEYLFESNTAMVGTSIVLVNPALPGVCYFPLFIPPTFSAWLTSTETITGAPDVEISTPYQPAYRDLPATMTDISSRGDQCNLRVNLPVGASLDGLVMTYSMTFASTTDLNFFSSIDDEKTSGKKFTTTDKRAALRFANAKLLYMMKEWANFYTDRLDVQVRKLLIEAESYYALSILFDNKSKQILNLINTDNFSVGDMSVNPSAGEQKELSMLYDNIALAYKLKGNEIIGLVMPPGSDTVRSTFAFDTSMSTSEIDDITFLI